MSLETLERPLDLSPVVPLELAPAPIEAGRPKWRAALAFAISGLALGGTLYYGAEATTTDPGEENPAPTMPMPRRDDRDLVTIEPLPTIPTQSLIDLTSIHNPTTTLELPDPNGKVDYTAAANSDQQVTTEKPPLPQREPTPWTEYTTRGR